MTVLYINVSLKQHGVENKQWLTEAEGGHLEGN